MASKKQEQQTLLKEKFEQAMMNVSMNGGYRESRANETQPKTYQDDPIVMKVLGRIADRATFGMNKYGVAMTRPDISTIQWLRHAQEEAMDLAIYLERVIDDLYKR